MIRTDCTEPHFLYGTAIALKHLMAVRFLDSLITCKIQLNHYTPIGCTASRALSACKLQLILYNNYGPYGLY